MLISVYGNTHSKITYIEIQRILVINTAVRIVEYKQHFSVMSFSSLFFVKKFFVNARIFK